MPVMSVIPAIEAQALASNAETVIVPIERHALREGSTQKDPLIAKPAVVGPAEGETTSPVVASVLGDRAVRKTPAPTARSTPPATNPMVETAASPSAVLR